MPCGGCFILLKSVMKEVLLDIGLCSCLVMLNTSGVQATACIGAVWNYLLEHGWYSFVMFCVLGSHVKEKMDSAMNYPCGFSVC